MLKLENESLTCFKPYVFYYAGFLENESLTFSFSFSSNMKDMERA
jgi:hypothetical protein